MAKNKVKINHQLAIDSWARAAQHTQKVHNPIMPNMADLVMDFEWDRITAAAAANTAVSYTFFNAPIGTGAKIKADTSLEQVSVLTAPEWMNVWSVGFYFTSDMVKTDIDHMLNNYWFEFWVGNKAYAQGPLQVAPCGFGLTGALTRNNEGTFRGTSDLFTNVPGFDLRLPAGLQLADGSTTNGLMGVTILQAQTFTVRLYGTSFALSAAAAPNNGVGLNLMAYLYGIKSRGVQ